MLILGLDWFCLNTSLNLDPACYFLPESPFLMGMGVVLSSAHQGDGIQWLLSYQQVEKGALQPLRKWFTHGALGAFITSSAQALPVVTGGGQVRVVGVI